MSHIFGILPKDLGITFTQLLMAKLKYLYIEHLRNISTCISPCPKDYMNFIVLRDLVFVCLLASFPRDWGLH